MLYCKTPFAHFLKGDILPDTQKHVSDDLIKLGFATRTKPRSNVKSSKDSTKRKPANTGSSKTVAKG